MSHKNEKFSGFWGFWRGVFSEADGTPSATRMLMFIISFVVVHIIYKILHVITSPACKVDQPTLALWLSTLPTLIAALTGFAALPYGINKGMNALGSVGSGIGTFITNMRAQSTINNPSVPAPLVNAGNQTVLGDGNASAVGNGNKINSGVAINLSNGEDNEKG